MRAPSSRPHPRPSVEWLLPTLTLNLCVCIAHRAVGADGVAYRAGIRVGDTITSISANTTVIDVAKAPRRGLKRQIEAVLGNEPGFVVVTVMRDSGYSGRKPGSPCDVMHPPQMEPACASRRTGA